MSNLVINTNPIDRRRNLSVLLWLICVIAELSDRRQRNRLLNLANSCDRTMLLVMDCNLSTDIDFFTNLTGCRTASLLAIN
jgi:hypothetical protein